MDLIDKCWGLHSSYFAETLEGKGFVETNIAHACNSTEKI